MATIPVDIVNRIQPQPAQLEVRFSAPLTTDMQVQSLKDLLKLRYNYQHKIVWVRDEVCYYYLADGGGELESNWKRHWNASTIEIYDENREYTIGELCYIGGIIYSAKKDVPIKTPPSENPDFWAIIAGEVITYRYVFDDTESITFTTNIKNPFLEIFEGKLTKNGDEYVKDKFGFIKLDDKISISAEVTDISTDSEPNTTLKVSFFSKGLPIKLSGIINVK